MEKIFNGNKYPRPFVSKEVITRDEYGYPTLTRFYSGEGQTGYTMFELAQTNSTTGINNLKAVKSKDILTPPASPVTGDRYWIGGVGAGAWLAKDYQIAEWDGAAWVYTAAVTGIAAYVTDLSLTFFYDGNSLKVLKEGIILKWSVQNVNNSI